MRRGSDLGDFLLFSGNIGFSRVSTTAGMWHYGSKKTFAPLMSSRAHSTPLSGVIAPRLLWAPHRTGLEDFPHPALQKHIL